MRRNVKGCWLERVRGLFLQDRHAWVFNLICYVFGSGDACRLPVFCGAFVETRKKISKGVCAISPFRLRVVVMGEDSPFSRSRFHLRHPL